MFSHAMKMLKGKKMLFYLPNKQFIQERTSKHDTICHLSVKNCRLAIATENLYFKLFKPKNAVNLFLMELTVHKNFTSFVLVLLKYIETSRKNRAL